MYVTPTSMMISKRACRRRAGLCCRTWLHVPYLMLQMVPVPQMVPALQIMPILHCGWYQRRGWSICCRSCRHGQLRLGCLQARVFNTVALRLRSTYLGLNFTNVVDDLRTRVCGILCRSWGGEAARKPGGNEWARIEYRRFSSSIII